MRKRIQKKSEVLREGYINGLRTAQRIINEALIQSQGFDDDIDEFESGTASGKKYATDVNKLNKELLKAAEGGYQSLVKKLLNKGVDANAKDESGNTPLHYAAMIGNSRICEMLLSVGADINARNEDDRTPLWEAVWKGYWKICDLLLCNGADANIEDLDGISPLQMAEEQGDTEIYKLFKEYGARM